MENTGNATYIERIKIEGLWDRFDVDWKLNPDVNILVGKNGTGKTTILQMIETLEDVTNLNNANKVVAIDYLKKIQRIKIQFNDTSNILGENGYKSLGFHYAGHFTIKPIMLGTFETFLLSKDEYEKEKKPSINTNLDKTLEDLIDAYVDYQLNQSQKALRKEKSIDDAFAKRTYFIETLNRLFADSGKIVDEKQNRISFLIGDKPISAYQLSSGEKQLLILLLTVLTQDEKPSVLLLDEPESSLHLDWQYELINILRTLNPNCQLIIVTHSPSIFTDGHKPKVFWIEDILHPTKQALAIAK